MGEADGIELRLWDRRGHDGPRRARAGEPRRQFQRIERAARPGGVRFARNDVARIVHLDERKGVGENRRRFGRSEEHTSELQSLMRISYAVFCLKKKNTLYSVARQHLTDESNGTSYQDV